ncbi:SDR family NAD(P)-dependent oxidoreductase [Verrucomicrobiaceae bacterium 227]
MNAPATMKDTVVLLTGATSPFDAALARGLTQLGASVHLAGPAGPLLDELSKENITTFALDLASRSEFVRVVDHILAHHNRIDLLINAAGTTILGTAQSLKPADWEEVFNTNILGTVNAIELVYPAMVERGSGHVVNIGSIVTDTLEAGAVPFAASKSFILGLDRSLGPEAAHFGVTLTLVLPGYLDPQLFNKTRTISGDHADATASHTLVHVTAEEVARAIIEGISNKRRRIFFPPVQARVLWHLAHWFPFTAKPLQKRFLKVFPSEDS